MKFKTILLFITIILISSLSEAQIKVKNGTYDPYVLPGSARYNKGKLGSRQKGKVSKNQKDYPDGYAAPGTFSYRNGSLKKWQKDFRAQLIRFLGLNYKEVNSFNGRQFNAWVKKFEIPKDKKHPFNKLLRPAGTPQKTKGYNQGQSNCATEDKNGKPLYNHYYPPRYELKDDHMVLYSCQSDKVGIRVYNVVYQGHEQKLISAFLFIPNETKSNLYRQAGGKVPTLIYYHGHGSNKYDSSFNPRSYVRGIAYHAALNGFVVLAPDVRGFGASKDNKKIDDDTDHKRIAIKARDKGKSFPAITAMDAIYAQDFLEKSDFKEFGLNRDIDNRFNVIGGVSMGGQIALYAGAIDDRFEVISAMGNFIGFEVMFSHFHCHCSTTPKLVDKLNIFDLGLMIAPRTLHVGMGGKDYFFNNYAKSAIEMLAYNLWNNDHEICYGNVDPNGLNFLRNISVRNDFKPKSSCPLVLQVDSGKKHEVIGLGYTFQKFWHDYLRK